MAGAAGQPACVEPPRQGPFATLAFELVTIEPMDAYAVAAGDFNGDCYPDLAAVGYAGGGVSVALVQPHGGFAPAGPSGRAAGGVPPSAIAVGDFNLDGWLDTVTSGNRSLQATVAFGNGAGAFDGGIETDLGQRQPRRLAPADLNGDGTTDLVFTPPVGSLLGNGDGTFRVVDPLVAFPRGSSRSFALADFDQNGALDLVIRDVTLFMLFGTSSGAFQESPEASPIPDVGDPLMAGDVDEDGNVDLLGTAGNGNVHVARGNGTGGFGPIEVAQAGVASRLIGIFDLNLDGHLDVVVASESGEELRVLPGRGDGTFGEAPAMPVARAWSLDDAVFADFNRDGRPDFAVAGRESAQVFLSVSH